MVLDYPAGPTVITRVLQRGDFFPGVMGGVNMGEWLEGGGAAGSEDGRNVGSL